MDLSTMERRPDKRLPMQDATTERMAILDLSTLELKEIQGQKVGRTTTLAPIPLQGVKSEEENIGKCFFFTSPEYSGEETLPIHPWRRTGIGAR
ncbi:hypothetical protein BRADI_1g44126v3 [Brachypodium distachyon]|uniref:Uncharacterized protein n=1 Tax=Brachypodium distachyon TaxID=15368 RepID=A0A2K2DP97_BRADI|nr:hypothetical protein BRADI_1g44126v3 [Brachypodium distachyon]